MAVENEKSAQVINNDAGIVNDSHSGKGQLFALFFDADPGAGDANSTIALVDVPAGIYRYLVFLSRIYYSAFGTARTMDVGWDAYTNVDGTAVLADEDGIHSAQDVAAAGSFSPGDELTTGSKLFDSQSGVRIRAKVEAAALGAGETLDGYLVFME